MAQMQLPTHQSSNDGSSAGKERRRWGKKKHDKKNKDTSSVSVRRGGRLALYVHVSVYHRDAVQHVYIHVHTRVYTDYSKWLMTLIK